MVIYFLALLVTSFSHWSSYSGIWNTTVYNVPWFKEREPEAPKHIVGRPLSTPALRDLLLRSSTSYDIPVFHPVDEKPLSPPRAPWADVEKGDLEISTKVLAHEPSKESLRPSWAKSLRVRRGVDQPFAMPKAPPKARPITAILKSYWYGNAAPIPPPKSSHLVLPNFNHSFDSLEAAASHATRSSYHQFPESVANPDLPIESRRLSEWVRADAPAGRRHPSPRLPL